MCTLYTLSSTSERNGLVHIIQRPDDVYWWWHARKKKLERILNVTVKKNVEKETEKWMQIFSNGKLGDSFFSPFYMSLEKQLVVLDGLEDFNIYSLFNFHFYLYDIR